MKSDNYLSGTHVTDLLLHCVLPEWLIKLARRGYSKPFNKEEFVADDRKGAILSKWIFPFLGILFVSVLLILFYVVEKEDAVRQIMSPSGLLSGTVLVSFVGAIVFLAINSVLSSQQWVERLQELEKRVCCYESFQASLGKANGPLGIFMFIGIEEDLFRRACKKLLDDLALQVVTRERCIPESYLLIEDEKKRFREVIEVLKELGVSDGDYKPHFQAANGTFAQMQSVGCFQGPLHHLEKLPVRLPELSQATA